MDHDDRTRTNNARAPTNDASPHDTGQQSNGTTFTGINPRNQRQNGRSLLSLNRNRHSQPSNPTRSDNSSQLPSIPNIRFRSIPNQNQSSMDSTSETRAESLSHLADFNVRSRGEGTSSSFPSNNATPPTLPSPIGTGPRGAMGGNSSSNHSRGRRQNHTRNRLHPEAASGSGANNSNTNNTSPKVRHRTGTSPRRRANRRSNNGSAANSNNSNSNTAPTSSTSTSTAELQESLGPYFYQPQQQWRHARFSDDSDDDLAYLMDTPPRMHNLPVGGYMGVGSLRGLGSEDEPFELNDSDAADPAENTSPLSLSRDEEMARQLQQEEWERASTPMDVGFRDPNRLQFLRAMHEALGSDDSPETFHHLPERRSRRVRQNLPPLPLFSGTSGGNPLQIPTLLELLPPGLMQALLGNGQFPPDEDDYEALLEMGEQIGAVNRGMSQRDINKIPVKKHRRSPSASGAERASSPSQDSASTQCSICLSEFNVGDSKRILPCQHELHKDCIDQWLKTNATCPICRKDIREGREDRV